MNDADFLRMLKKSGKIKLMSSSSAMSRSYSSKADMCFKSARILHDKTLYETSIIMSYYSAYNISLSLFAQYGIRCKNHAAAVLLLSDVFQLKEASDFLAMAKKERVKNQYQFTDSVNMEIMKGLSSQLITQVSDYILAMQARIVKSTKADIANIMSKFASI